MTPPQRHTRAELEALPPCELELMAAGIVGWKRAPSVVKTDAMKPYEIHRFIPPGGGRLADSTPRYSQSFDACAELLRFAYAHNFEHRMTYHCPALRTGHGHPMMIDPAEHAIAFILAAEEWEAAHAAGK